MKKKSLPLDAGMLESQKEFSEAYKAHNQRILWYVLRRTQDRKVAEDLVSIMFIKAWKARASFKGGSVQAWFYQIARNVLTDYWRKKRDIPLGDNEEAVADAIDDAERLDDELQLVLLRSAMARLPPTMYAILTMRFIEGRSTKEVAQVMGLSEANIRVMQYRALKRIRKYLHET